jgi:predicted dehydrogenase
MTDATPLKVGVVGLGYAGTTHAESYLGIPGIEVVALAGKEPERLAFLGESLGIPKLFSDWEDLVALPELDIVSVATPNALHGPISIAALEAGKHVFCEKPLAIHADEARRMGEIARANDRVLEVAFNHRRRADVQYLKRYLDDPGIGEIYHVRATWKRRAGIPGLMSWFTSKSLAGGGALIDLGPHVLDIVLFLLGEPRVTTASAAAHGALGRAGYGAMDKGAQFAGGHASFEVEDLASALLRTDRGQSIQYEISWAGHTADDEDISIELLGVEGGARILVKRYATDGTLTIYRDINGEQADIVPAVHVVDKGHPTVIAEFIDIVRSGDWADHHGDTAVHRTEIIDACYESARLDREVAI